MTKKDTTHAPLHAPSRLWTEDELTRLATEDDSLHDDGFADSLPPLPPRPEGPDDVVAIFVPTVSKPRVVRKAKRGRDGRR